MSKKLEHELNPETPTRELKYGGVGEPLEVEEAEADLEEECIMCMPADEDITDEDAEEEK